MIEASPSFEPTQAPVLARTPGFAALDEATRATVLATLERRLVPAGASALRAGDDRHAGLIVCTGCLAVRAHGAPGPETAAGPGTLIGLEQLLTTSAPDLRAAATVSSEVLVLTRAALLASPAARLLGRELVHVLRLRLSLMPRAGVRLIRPAPAVSAENPGLLVHPGYGGYRLSAMGCWLWQRLDGRRTYQDLVLLYLRDAGMLALEPLAALVAGLARAGFLAPLPLAPDLAVALYRRPRWQRMRAGTTWRRNSTAPVTALEQIYHRVGWRLCTRSALALQALSVGAGLAALCRGASRPRQPLQPLPRLLALAGPLVAHELGHALAMLRLGFPVIGMGVGTRRLIPVVFVDTTAMWLGSPRQRLVVALAGAWANLAIGGALLLGAWRLPRAAPSLRVGARASYGWALLALLPCCPDGQQMLAALRDALGGPDGGARARERRRVARPAAPAVLARAAVRALAARCRAGGWRAHA